MECGISVSPASAASSAWNDSTAGQQPHAVLLYEWLAPSHGADLFAQLRYPVLCCHDALLCAAAVARVRGVCRRWACWAP